MDHDAADRRKRITGKIVALPTSQTAIIEVSHFKHHPVYKKSLKRTRRFACHTVRTDLQIGDTVDAFPVRPMSRTKHLLIDTASKE